MPDYLSYQRSISAELNSVKDRIRYFIENRHWGEDGRFKEIILRDCIKSKLPNNVKIGTGFVVGNYDITKQIDLIVYRAEIPPLFKKDEFVILPKEAVLGIVEVKTKLCSINIDDTFRNCHYNGQIIDNPHIFNGIFSFEDGFNLETGVNNIIKDNCKRYHGYINNVAFGQDYFMKYWSDGFPNHERKDKYKIYSLKDLAFGYFISNLIEDAYNQTQNKELSEIINRAFYPLEETKEAHIVETIFVNPIN